MENEKENVKRVVENVRLSDDETKVIILDQEKLPNVEEYLELDNTEDIYEAIFCLKVRGAPAIGICAGYGIYVLARKIETDDFDTFYREFKEKDRVTETILWKNQDHISATGNESGR